MAKEYKFMFDRSFDTPEETTEENVEHDSLASLLKTVENIISYQKNSPDGDDFFSTDEFIPADGSLSLVKNIDDSEKIFFDNGNESSEEIPVEEEEKNIVVYTQEELDKAVENAKQEAETTAFENGLTQGKAQGYEDGKKDGFALGLEEGKTTAKNEFESDRKTVFTNALEQMAQTLLKISDECVTEQTVLFEQTLALTRAVFEKALPSFLKRNGGEEIVSFLQEALGSLKQEQKITLRIHPDMTAPLKEHLSKIMTEAAFSGKISVIKDETLRTGDCCVEWKNGSVERKIKNIETQIDALLNAYAKTAGDVEKTSDETGEM